MDSEKSLPILLTADENENECNLLNKVFGDEFEVVSVTNGLDCIDFVEKNKVAVVLVSLKLPVMDGFEVLNVIAKDSRFADVPVIVITDREDSEGEARAMENGAAEFLTTPLNETVIKYRVHNVLARYENERNKIERAVKDLKIFEMHRSLEIDSLTGLYNRPTFYKKAANLVQAHPETKYYIVYLDISCFKAINDLFHMETGNLILKTAASYFMNKINPHGGICSRIEADHFVLCVPQESFDPDKLIEGLDNAIQTLGISHNILFFAGIYPVNNVYLPADQMCDRANMALRKVKGNYLTRYAYYDAGMREQMLQEQMIVRDMNYALKDNQFTIYLQPVYSLAKDTIVSAEALVRWFHPVNGMISPGKFIPVFERNGFIVKLDRFVWEEVCKFLRRQLDEGVDIMPVSVNVSRLNFYNLDLLEFLPGLLEKYNLEPEMLKLEVTESAYTDNPQQLISITRMFRERGFSVLMDDFGSGFSSLNMLKNLPIDVLKVDMAFVRELEESDRARTILRFVLGLAQDLGMGVVIEGVETQNQLNYISKLGKVDIQGYFFSRPLPVEDFKILYNKYSLNKNENVTIERR